MVNEKFLDKSFELFSSIDNSYIHIKDLFLSIVSILKDYKHEYEKSYINQPEFKEKFDFLLLCCLYRISEGNKFNLDEYIERINMAGKYKKFTILLESSKKELTEEYITNIFMNDILLRRNLVSIIKDKTKFKKLLEDVEYENFDDINDLLEQWKTTITSQYNQITSVNRLESLSNATSLDLFVDDYTPVINKFKESVLSSSKVQSGFNSLDKYLPYNGFEKRRIFIFAGETGIGKSIILNNILVNNIKNYSKNKVELANSKKPTHVYITAENLIDESLVRFFCALTNCTKEYVAQSLLENKDFDLKKEICNYLNKANMNVLFHYLDSNVGTLADVESILEAASEKYDLQAVYVDYLDLIRSGTDAELRIELGEVTVGLKNLAIKFDVPVITATQLNRSGYNQSSPSVTQLSESHKKSTDADTIISMQSTEEGYSEFKTPDGSTILGKQVKLTIIKNRNAPSGKSLTLILPDSMNGIDVFNFKFEEVSNINFMNDSDLMMDNLQ